MTDDDIIKSDVTLSNGILYVRDIAAGESDDSLSLSVAGDDLVITDVNLIISAGPGAAKLGSGSIDGQTVFDDGHEDNLFGENASDVFFVSVGLGDILQDRLPQETVLEI